jgi:riboflavin kinase
MDEILLLLLRRGAHRRPLRLTTSELGALAGMSQQNASRKLTQLEAEGYIERGNDGIRLTGKAYNELSGVYSALKAAFEGGGLEIEGRLVKGLGEGGFYVSLEGYRMQFMEKLGFRPFPGTLNVMMKDEDRWKRQRILQAEPVIISGFRDKERTYGDLFAYRCRLDGRGCAIIFPLRTHHGPDIIEIVCPFNAKKEIGKKDGDRVKVVV